MIYVPGSSPLVICKSLSIFDIVVPVNYISFLSRFGKEKFASFYFYTHFITYCVSLCIAALNLTGTRSGQPVLMYAVPLLFICTYFVLFVKGDYEFKYFFNINLHGPLLDDEPENRPNSTQYQIIYSENCFGLDKNKHEENKRRVSNQNYSL